MKLQGLLAGAALMLAACGGGGDEEVATLSAPVVSDVTVSSDLSAVGSRDAATYWGNLESDLESAIAAQFIGQTGPDGVRLLVDVDELSIASFFESQAGASDGRLTGTVTVLDGTTGEPLGLYTVSATADQAMTQIPSEPGTRVQTVPATSSEFYSALLRAFAVGVADAVNQGGTPAPA
ncbi:MAG TPA: hypothetical protein VK022_07295 [Paracoccaceae bacterium]|nr:hypothetical protein [Paracoccaceae bacterium]